MTRLSLFLLALAAILCASTTQGVIPRTISYQGVLTDANGVVVADGTYSMTFRIYDASGGGNLLWEETQNVAVTSGRFDAILGKSTSLDPLPFDETYWLAFLVDGDPEMTPRIELTATGFSLNSRTVEDGAITSSKIATGTVVRSVNAMTGNVVIQAGANVSISQFNDSLLISTTGVDSDWTVAGNDMYPAVSGNVGIGTTTPTAKLDIVGTTKTEVLEITGGADLAEPFPVTGETIVEGALLVIDDEHPGRLTLSDRPYDRRVAGVVSGAGGVRPGLMLSHSGFEGGPCVALSGRVYVLADASSDPIRPGDLLTTSTTPGHAMKASDPERSHGAIVGKAMSSLDSGRGLVLVLVNLQ